MQDKIVKITITPKGEASIDAQGFKGTSCKDATKVFEDLYTNKIGYEQKPEMFQGAQCSTNLVHVRQ